ncbi:MAG TPA: DUF1295 domain-containing protein [Bacteroidia bacterium]|nr:DUF1295 domain-containing protein [Bacteroidia bacterium]HRH09025.1 DUF1295 domain-containing protein [Bacteroidia bacterium]HRH64095.1 DUF1295 domain-containing protein [Bacteroidia bacterium]
MLYSTYEQLILAWMAVGIVTFFILLKVTAPYGRHSSSGWGPMISNRLGWILMEVPVMLCLLYFMREASVPLTNYAWMLLALFFFHYLNRTFIFPLRIKTKGKKMPLLIVVSAILFNVVNGSSLGYYFANFASYTSADFMSMHFILGALLFCAGLCINWIYDTRLINMRKESSQQYVIPQGALFNVISCPNLFGEIVEWSGFALMCWNLPALAFLVWTLANLLPRAISHHRWYLQKFEDYPKERKAVIPFII